MKRKSYTLRACSHRLDLGLETQVMGIINMTPDSFSRDGCLAGSRALQKARKMAFQMIRDGAHILDIGGESSRPGSLRISVDEELKRVIPLIKALSGKVHVPLSVDTFKPRVAQEALDAGASIINVIKGISPDPKLLKIIRDYKAAVVLMHMRGTPRTMQKNVFYENLIDQVMEGLCRSVRLCLDAGISRNQIIVDPGIGFGKTLEHNLRILNHLDRLRVLGCPVLVGVSRKSFIGDLTGRNVDQRLAGSLAGACAAVTRGAHIIRVHDVPETAQALQVIDAILKSPR